MPLARDELVARLIEAGELEVMGGNQSEIDNYFDTEQFRFHGPGGFEADYGGLANYFKSMRAAFDDRSIRRGIKIVEGNYVACQTGIEGRFVREFTQSPAGPLPPRFCGQTGFPNRLTRDSTLFFAESGVGSRAYDR